MADSKDQSNSVTFHLDSMAGLHGAVAVTRSLPFLSDLGLPERVLISTVVSELGVNIIKFAGRGTVSLARIRDRGHDAIQVIAEDNGPGIRDVEMAMQNGYSTADTLGLGLPAVRRMMSTMTIETAAGKGTRVVACKWLDGCSPEPDAPRQHPETGLPGLMSIEYAEEVRPCPGEIVSGDLALLRPLEHGLLFGIIDVSGHGTEAYVLACRLGRAVGEEESVEPEVLLKALHRHATGTRGAAAGLAFLDRARRRLSYAGIGNVHIRVLGAQSWRGVSRNGILGERLPGVLTQSVGLSSGDVIVIASDGVSESSRTSVLIRGSILPAKQIAREVILLAGKNTDDAACVVVKCL